MKMKVFVCKFSNKDCAEDFSTDGKNIEKVRSVFTLIIKENQWKKMEAKKKDFFNLVGKESSDKLRQ